MTTINQITNVHNKNLIIADEKIKKHSAAIKELQVNNVASSQALGILRDNLV